MGLEQTGGNGKDKIQYGRDQIYASDSKFRFLPEYAGKPIQSFNQAHLILRTYSGCRTDKESRKTSYGAASVVVVMMVVVVAAVGRERWN